MQSNVYSNDRKSLLNEVQYGNGGKVKYSYDEYDRVTGITHDSDTDPKFRIEYDSRGRAARVTDAEGGSVTNSWDTTQRPVESEQRDGSDALKYRNLIEYDNKNRVSKFHEVTGSGTHKTEYQYDKDNRVKALRYDGSNNYLVNYTFDKLNRITSRKITNSVEYNTVYGYVHGNTAYGTNATTPLVASITQGSGANAFNLAYTYDDRGNITSETRNGNTTTYEYDKLGQLVRVNDPWDNTIAIETQDPQYTGTTWIYAYDRGGNILSKTAYEFTTGTIGTAVRTYTYGYTDSNWKDKLTTFDNNTITYDGIGNPLNDGTWTYVWQAGRQLRSMSRTEGNDTITVEFEYDHAGLRTKKTKKVNDAVREVTEYILNGKNVVELKRTVYTTVGEETTTTVDVLHFYYDAQGRAAMVKYNGVMYGYVHDLQGDVIGILDNTGSVAVEYKYDAWGRPLSVTGTLAATLGELNPFRYRGYVFDNETQLYYLRSRYYNTYRSLFTNPDKEAVLITGNKLLRRNSFLYGNNNPINMIDQNGDDAIWIQERNSAMTFGHSGLMAQNAEGDWYYFFWGPQSEDISKEVVLTGTPNGSFIQKISIEENDITNTDTLKKVLENAGENAAIRADLITDTYYFKGDYTATYEKANQFVQSGDKYSVLRNNCVQKTYEAFLASDSRFLWVSFKNLDSMVPNRIADQVSMIPSQKSKTPWKLILLNLLS